MTTQTEAVETTVPSTTTEPQTTQPQGEKTPEPVAIPQERVTSRLAKLAKQEESLAAEKAQVEQLKKEIEASQLTNKEKLDLLADLKNKLQENPDEVFEKLGISFQDITKSILESSDPTAKELRSLQSELKKIKEEREEEKRQREEAELQLKGQKDEQVINEYKSGVLKYIDENPEKYELIKSTEMQDEVWNVITRHYESTKELLTEEQACDFVENYLEEAQLKKLLGTKKLSRLLEGNRSSGDKTLSSSVGASNVGTIETSLSEDQRFEKALSILKTRKK